MKRVADAVRIGRRSLAIARQSVLAGIGLSLVAMVFAALGFIPPVFGALLQEGIDIAVILNALRRCGRQFPVAGIGAFSDSPGRPGHEPSRRGADGSHREAEAGRREPGGRARRAGASLQPEEIGFTRHSVFLSGDHVVFVFEGGKLNDLLRAVVKAPTSRRAARVGAGARRHAPRRPRGL